MTVRVSRGPVAITVQNEIKRKSGICMSTHYRRFIYPSGDLPPGVQKLSTKWLDYERIEEPSIFFSNYPVTMLP